LLFIIKLPLLNVILVKKNKTLHVNTEVALKEITKNK